MDGCEEEEGEGRKMLGKGEEGGSPGKKRRIRPTKMCQNDWCQVRWVIKPPNPGRSPPKKMNGQIIQCPGEWGRKHRSAGPEH